MEKKFVRTGLVMIRITTGKSSDPENISFLEAAPGEAPGIVREYLEMTGPQDRISYMALPNATITVTIPHVERDPDYLIPYMRAVKTATRETFDTKIAEYLAAKDRTTDPVTDEYESLDDFVDTSFDLMLDAMETNVWSPYPSAEITANIEKAKRIDPYVTVDLSHDFKPDDHHAWIEFDIQTA